MAHMRTCRDETFYDASNYLHQKNWVEAPKGQHIVINEESTNIVLKTTGLWLMPEPNDSQMNSDSLRGFWVMPTSTTDYLEQQRQEQIQREQQEKLRLQQEQQRLQEQQEKLRIQQEQKRLQELEKQRREQEIQHQLLIEQQQQQQKQLMLQQQLARQSTITSPNAVPLIKSSPTSVISQLNQSSRSHAPPSASTIIVLNDDQFLTAQTGGSDALRCIQASDGSYHVIGNVDLNEKTSTSNATSVIAHTSPAPIESAASTLTTTTRKRRGRPKQQQQPQQNSVIYAQQNDTELVYETQDVPVVTMTKQTKRRRGGGGGGGAVTSNANEIISTISNHTIVQNVDSPEVPAQHQQFYIAYNDNGVLVPIGPQSPIVKNDINTAGVMDLSQEQYIIEDLDASHKAQQQRNRNKIVTITENVTISPASVSAAIHPTLSGSLQNSAMPTNTTTSTTNSRFARNTNDDSLAYNIDDLSHLDKPIGNEKETKIAPIKPLKTKPEFMDSFYTFLMNREANKL